MWRVIQSIMSVKTIIWDCPHLLCPSLKHPDIPRLKKKKKRTESKKRKKKPVFWKYLACRTTVMGFCLQHCIWLDGKSWIITGTNPDPHSHLYHCPNFNMTVLGRPAEEDFTKHLRTGACSLSEEVTVRLHPTQMVSQNDPISSSSHI